MIVTVEMGYGHLRAAHTLAELFGTEVIRMDLPPIASPAEAAAWRGILNLIAGNAFRCSGVLSSDSSDCRIGDSKRGENPLCLGYARLPSSFYGLPGQH